MLYSTQASLKHTKALSQHYYTKNDDSKFCRRFPVINAFVYVKAHKAFNSVAKELAFTVTKLQSSSSYKRHAWWRFFPFRKYGPSGIGGIDSDMEEKNNSLDCDCRNSCTAFEIFCVSKSLAVVCTIIIPPSRKLGSNTSSTASNFAKGSFSICTLSSGPRRFRTTAGAKDSLARSVGRTFWSISQHNREYGKLFCRTHFYTITNIVGNASYVDNTMLLNRRHISGHQTTVSAIERRSSRMMESTFV
jgi:hypothetical protein